MKKKTFYILLILLIHGCNYSKTSSPKEKNKIINLENLINKNKDKILFLSFWEDMSENELEIVKKYETEKGNLKNGNFILMLPTTKSSYDEIPFSINLQEKSLVLTYTDDYWVYRKDIAPTDDKLFVWEKYAQKRGNDYIDLENYLIKTFDEKYERIKSYTFLENPIRIWKTIVSDNKSHIITLEVNYWYHYSISNDNLFAGFTLKNGKQKRIEPDENNKRDKVASCEIEIKYEMLNTYLEREKVLKENVEKNEKEKVQQENEIKNKIDENKSKL